MTNKIKPNKEQFKVYLIIQKSGVTNMFDTKVIEHIAKDVFNTILTKAECLYIYEHYSDLINEYNLNNF